jgi:hypothetical protein
MRATSKFLALALAAMLQPAFAAPAPIELSFEDLTTKVDDDGLVDMTTLDYGGVAFKGKAWGLTNSDCDGVAKFLTRDGGCGAVLLAATRAGSSGGTEKVTINLANGFITGSSLFYSAMADSALTVTLYEDVDGKGRATAYAPPALGLKLSDCTISPFTFCDWNELKFVFEDVNAVAKSVVISGLDRSVMLDDLSFLPAATTAPNPLPEPGGVALALAALGALGWARKRAA